jgi:hypothetical protein
MVIKKGYLLRMGRNGVAFTIRNEGTGSEEIGGAEVTAGSAVTPTLNHHRTHEGLLFRAAIGAHIKNVTRIQKKVERTRSRAM